MSNDKPQNPYAFPRLNGPPGCSDGMSLRDWFAGNALAGLLTDPEYADATPAPTVAKAAYRLADAMLAAREGK